jgi:hypothetical protein
VFSGLAASILADQHLDGAGLASNVVAAAPHLEADPTSVGSVDEAPSRPAGQVPDLPDRPALEPERATQLVHDLGAIPGVGLVVTAHALPDDPELVESLVRSGADIGTPLLVSCADAAALGFERCDGTTVLNMASDRIEPTGFTPSTSVGALDDLPVVGVAAVTDGRVATIERARTRLELGIPGTPAVTQRDIDAEWQSELHTMQRVNNVGLSVTLVIAGCSLAVAVAGAIVERKQPFALLRLTGTRLSDLRRIVLAEAAAPLLAVATASVALGLAVAALVLATGIDRPFAMPGPSYWLALVAGLGVALLVVLATLPLLSRLTALDSTRFE